MARRQEKNYVWKAQDPDYSNNGTIKIDGHIILPDLLLVVNVTRGVIIYNFNDPSKLATWYHNHDFDSDFPTAIDGTCVFELATDTSGMSDSDELAIYIEENRRGLTVRPPEFGLDSIERARVSAPESLIDADFEYGIQLTKWDNVGVNRNIPSFYELPRETPLIDNITSGGQSPFSLITVDYNASVGSTSIPQPGEVISVRGTNNALADGLFIVESGTPGDGGTSQYRAKGVVGTGVSLLNAYTQAKEGGIFEAAEFDLASFVVDTGNPTSGIVTVTLNSNHGLVPGSPILVADSTSGKQTHEGRFFVEEVINGNSFRYNADTTLSDTPTLGNISIYAANDAFVNHAPFDGGVRVGNALPVHGLECKRQTKRYFRYQSGKGILFSTGALLAPNFDIDDILIINGQTELEVITAEFHGLQTGAGVAIVGIGTDTAGDSELINTTHVVSGITSETCFRVTPKAGIAGTAFVQLNSKVGITTWSGAAVRTGIYDNLNGMYWEFDGTNVYAVKRSNTFQIAGYIAMTQGSSLVTGSGTKFTTQLVVGDCVTIKGQRYHVVGIVDDTTCYVAPQYRGVNFQNSKMTRVIEERIPQSKFNRDKLDGNGPSHYNLETDGRVFRKMQMLGIQYSWYGAGYIDYCLRGPLGEWIVAHRIANNNRNDEAYMRSGNLPARYEVSHYNARTKLTSNTGFTATTLNLANASEFPVPLDPAYPGYVEVTSYQGSNVVHELMSYTGKTGNTLTGVTTATTYTKFLAGQNRTFYGSGSRDLVSYDHPAGSGVILVTTNCAPTITHWGSAVIMDGGFDGDPTLEFNLSKTDITVNSETATMVGLFRPAPAVSDTLAGEVGERELINRSIIKLDKLFVSARQTAGNQAVVTIEIVGILNPTGYENSNWVSANEVPFTVGALDATFVQPSFVQYDPTETTLPSDGEILFKFQLRSDESKEFDLAGVKELQNSILGGNKTYPDGPDVLAVIALNRATVAGGNALIDLALSWKEAQA